MHTILEAFIPHNCSLFLQNTVVKLSYEQIHNILFCETYSREKQSEQTTHTTSAFKDVNLGTSGKFGILTTHVILAKKRNKWKYQRSEFWAERDHPLTLNGP